MRLSHRLAIVIAAGFIYTGVSTAQRSPVSTSVRMAAPVDDTAIQDRAHALDIRLAAYAAARRLPKARIDKLRLAIGRVQTQAGHQARVNGSLTAIERKAFVSQLDAIKRQISRS